MPPELIKGMIEATITGAILGVAVWRLGPQIIQAFERITAAFTSALERREVAHREELAAVRKDHRVDLRHLTAELHRLARGQEAGNRERERQTCELRELRRDLSQDLPGPPPLPLPEPTETVDLTPKEDP